MLYQSSVPTQLYSHTPILPSVPISTPKYIPPDRIKQSKHKHKTAGGYSTFHFQIIPLRLRNNIPFLPTILSNKIQTLPNQKNLPHNPLPQKPWHQLPP